MWAVNITAELAIVPYPKTENKDGKKSARIWNTKYIYFFLPFSLLKMYKLATV